MKPATAKFSKPRPPVHQTVVEKPGPLPKAAVPAPKSLKQDNIFSKSHDTRENRSARQMKTKNNPQTVSHGH